MTNMDVLAICSCFLFLSLARCDDPEKNMNARQMILFNGYPEEDHWVTTEDGFILGLQRIPHSKTDDNATDRPVIFLQHGLLCSSTNWITNLEYESLAFLLSDAGFDVWLGNIRGNTYSTNHTTLHPSDAAFWAWSYDEMARYDLPAMLYYVINVTNQSDIYYVGHSQGTLMAFIGFSMNAKLASHIKAYFALAPVARYGHAVGLMRYIAYAKPEIKDFIKLFGIRDFLPSNEFTKIVAQFFCNEPFIDGVCDNVLFLLFGYDEANLNETRVPIYLSHTPAGTSVQNMYHFAQGVRYGTFQMYDYGSTKANMAHYNNSTPPQYNLTNFHVPTHVYAGGQDDLANPTDVAWLIEQLSATNALLSNQTIPSYEHLDFIWGEDARTRVYADIIEKAKASAGNKKFIN
ncbi:gastric triacylglycerol lipase-like [Oscarella lobularis]|uniref:gastric triacylglycerol lipase-like n=1 Tax=Oscarella lobularis TaxID=121494 RepID=UPI0033139EDB